MKYSGIGGQAVMEGVMMRNGDSYAVAVRKPDHEIEVKVETYKGAKEASIWKKIPIIRGVISFFDSLVLGMGSLSYSASFFEEEEESEKQKAKSEEQKKKEEKWLLTGTLALSVVIAVAVFMILPYYLSQIFQPYISSGILLTFVEGIIRLLIFFAYIKGISLMEDIKRVFQYHGAEHKCINCIENGMELTVENVRKASRQHKRCGTSFLLIVMVVSIVFFAFIQVDSKVLRLVLRLLLVPVIAGVSFEFIRLAGRSENPLVQILSKPGMWLQNLTTREPDDEMIEVGIASVEAIFDWKDYLAQR